MEKGGGGRAREGGCTLPIANLEIYVLVLKLSKRARRGWRNIHSSIEKQQHSSY